MIIARSGQRGKVPPKSITYLATVKETTIFTFWDMITLTFSPRSSFLITKQLFMNFLGCGIRLSKVPPFFYVNHHFSIVATKASEQ
jgi:hypothetical protein